MTTKEAIEVLNQEKNYLNGGPSPAFIDYEDALEVAIAALMAQQESKGVEIDQFRNEPLTNADRFRSKTDEELAEFMSCFVPVLDCPGKVWSATEYGGMKYKDAWLEWLKQPAKEETP